jgi:uncharacterized membrane protein
VLAAAAWRAHALTRGGALAAFVVGTLTYGSGGWAFTLVLLAFFVPSVALSRVGRARKKLLVDIGKGGARDAWQVFANGGVATVCAVVGGEMLAVIDSVNRAGGTSGTSFIVVHLPGLLLGPFTHASANALPAHAWVAAFAGSYAAATADTWGTEIGTLARGKPHSILTFRPIAAGLSGGVTWAGTAAEVAGAAWIALTAAAVTARAAFIIPVAVGGIAGALTDSLLGATVQELRRCPTCDRTCETNPHICGTPTMLVRGIPRFSNDVVNFAATLTGAAVAFALTTARV